MKLEMKDVSYGYGLRAQKVLKQVSFELEPGSYWCVAGPNGSGKSTFLKLLCGLLPQGGFSGQILWEKKSVFEWKRLSLAQNLAFVPSSLKTSYPIDVESFVLQGRFSRSSIWSKPTDQEHELVSQALQKVGLNSVAEKWLTEISAGELQLALIARALVQEPKVLVLDEATANLDLQNQIEVFHLLADLNSKGISILVVSHDLNLAAEFCPNVLWLKDGQVVTSGAFKDTLTQSLLTQLYGIGTQVEVGQNPFTSQPKLFFK